MQRPDSPAAQVRLQATMEIDFLTPEGTRLWMTTLMPDRDSGEARHRINLVATAETEEMARQALGLVALRLRAALELVEEAYR